MKIYLLTFLILIAPLKSMAGNRKWSQGTAYTLPKGQIETGLFSPLRYGLTNDVELSTFPIFFFVMPNISVKKAWFENSKLIFSSKHTISYPSPILKLFSRKGTGGVLPANTKVPHIVSFSSDAIVSFDFYKQLVSVYAGTDLSTHFGEMKMTTIDFPLVYQRSASYYSGYDFRAGVDIEGRIYGSFYYLVDLDLFFMPNFDTHWAIEHKTYISYRHSPSFQILAGYKFSYGDYPFGKASRFFPIIDLMWSF